MCYLLNHTPCGVLGIIQNHVLGNVICSSVLDGRVKSENELGHYLNLTRTDTDHLMVNDAEVIIKDIMATNGVVHVIDTVLLPDEGKKDVKILLDVHWSPSVNIPLLRNHPLIKTVFAENQQCSL